METVNGLPKNIINPFSNTFLSTWQLWKDFRWEEHKFKYKGCISEQMALKKLVELSHGDEQVAIRIVIQSIEGPWTGFYPLKTIKLNNGKQTKPTVEQTHSELNDLYSKRFSKTG